MKFDNQYLTYLEYRELGGKLLEMPFNLLERDIEKEIDLVTSSRFKKITKDEYPEDLKLCVYDLMEKLPKYNFSTISSESVGNYTKVNKSNEEIKKERNEIISRATKKYLSDIKVNNIYVLYNGADIDGN